MIVLNKTMKKYQINKENFIEEKDLHIIHVYNKIWVDSYSDDMELLIRYFNQEYTWDSMFQISDVVKRVDSGDNLFLLYYGSRAIGYVFYKKLDEETCFGYNLYVTKLIERPKYAASWFYNRTTNKMLQSFKKINVEIEDWNKVVFDIVESIGYTETIE